MSKASRWLALLLVTLVSPLHAQPEPKDWCNQVCSSSWCDEYCWDGLQGSTTCAEFLNRTNRDYDSDGVLYPNDNCACLWNPNQVNCDGDSWGDACDSLQGTWVVDGSRYQVQCGTNKVNHTINYEAQVTYETKYIDISACGRSARYDHQKETKDCAYWTSFTECCQAIAVNDFMCTLAPPQWSCWSSVDTYPPPF